MIAVLFAFALAAILAVVVELMKPALTRIYVQVLAEDSATCQGFQAIPWSLVPRVEEESFQTRHNLLLEAEVSARQYQLIAGVVFKRVSHPQRCYSITFQLIMSHNLQSTSAHYADLASSRCLLHMALSRPPC